MSNSFVSDAVTGGVASTGDIAERVGKAAARLDELVAAMQDAKDTDTARWDALNEERKAQAATLTELKAEHDQKRRDDETAQAIAAVAELKAQLANTRGASKAGMLSGGHSRSGYEPGSFIGSLVDLLPSADPDVRSAAKATLLSLTQRQDAWGKATVGDTDATGGWIVPNAIVDSLIVPGQAANIYRDLMTSVTNVTAPAVDLPYRSAARSKATIAGFGTLKENLDLAYGGYTATMYTLARIYDLGNQFLRQSRGAAEQDVMQELAAAFALGESYYIREGTGSSQPYGYTPALTNGPAAYRSSFSPSATTLAGSIAAAIATASGALSARGSTPTAAVMSASAYWTMLAQGTDSAGFFFAPANGPTAIRPGTLVTPFGVPVYPDAAADMQGTGTVTDNLVVANWRAFKVFYGAAYRVESNSSAGTRWDYNLTGFRGEEEIGFDARPVVYSGHAQMITDILP